MKAIVIADDLTGANDTGLQFAKKGLDTSVHIQVYEEGMAFSNSEVTVIDTDSRALSAQDAYHTVAEVARQLKETTYNFIFKKVDSTLRGNISAELKALTDHIHFDMTMVAPAYPPNHRIVKDGYLYVGDIPVHQTGFADDPKNPMHTSYIPDIINKDDSKKVKMLSQSDILKGEEHILQLIQKWEQEGHLYIVCDTTSQQELGKTVSAMQYLNRSILWVGSAGLAQALDPEADRKMEKTRKVPIQHNAPVLTISGSVHPQTAKQVDVLKTDNVYQVISVNASRLITGKRKEIERIEQEVHHVLKGNHSSLVICSSGKREDVQKAVNAGKQQGMSPAEVSEVISQSMGKIAKELLERYTFSGLVLTGGDIAKKVCESLGIESLHLLDEIEEGIPVGYMEWKGTPILTITKAGGFGSERALQKAIRYIRERDK